MIDLGIMNNIVLPKYNQPLEEYYEYLASAYLNSNRDLFRIRETFINLTILGNIVILIDMIDKANYTASVEFYAVNRDISKIEDVSGLNKSLSGLLVAPFDHNFDSFNKMLKNQNIIGNFFGKFLIQTGQ